MTMRFSTHLQLDCLADELLDNSFEVIMPELDILNNGAEGGKSENISLLSSLSQTAGYIGEKYLYQPIVEEINFTPQTLSTDTRRIRTSWIHVPKDKEAIGDVTITMFCSNGMLTQYYLEAWRNLIFNRDGEYFYSMSAYKKNIEVYFYGPGTTSAMPPVAHFTLKGCFPYSQKEYNFKYSPDPKRVTITAKFKVDSIAIDQQYAKTAMKKELVGSPMSVVDNTYQKLFSAATSSFNLKNLVG